MYDEWFGHKGMLRTALSVKKVLETKKILDEAFNKCPVGQYCYKHRNELVDFLTIFGMLIFGCNH